jgi:hypothetical protein
MVKGCVSAIGGRGEFLQYDEGVCFCNRRRCVKLVLVTPSDFIRSNIACWLICGQLR